MPHQDMARDLFAEGVFAVGFFLGVAFFFAAMFELQAEACWITAPLRESSYDADRAITTSRGT